MTPNQIRGIVREKTSGAPLAGLEVRAFDREPPLEEQIGRAITAKDGSFEILSDTPGFREFLKESPDVHLDVVLSDGRVYAARHDLRWRGGQLESVTLHVPGPREKGSGGHQHEHQHNHDDDHGPGHDHDTTVRMMTVSTAMRLVRAARRDEQCHHSKPPDRCRSVYLKIEKLPAYSPVAPDDAEHHKHRLDCMRNPLHEDGTIPNAEVEQRKLDAVVYREYLDPAFTVPNTAPIVAADINEPRYERRIPGAVLYAEPGERLFIHVLNADDHPHSFHLHGLVYGIDSDGSWPFGVMDADGRRSDAICPGDEWC
jgi:hypothetical protein